jgi:transcriptional regulator of met regulon
MNPRQFFDEFVTPCVEEWQLDPLNVRKAVIAISQIDILADVVLIHQHPGFTRRQLANVRKATEQNTRIRLLVRDVHDTHKHGPLHRPTATITTGERKLERRGAGCLSNAFQNNTVQVGTSVLEIVQDDGTKHLVENVITDALTYWEGELLSLGL